VPHLRLQKTCVCKNMACIFAQIPDAQCHIYGSYTHPEIQALHSPKGGFLVKGHAPSLEVLGCYRGASKAPRPAVLLGFWPRSTYSTLA